MLKNVNNNWFNSNFIKDGFNYVVKRFSHVNAMLSGIRILDLTRIVAGPYCTMVLADMGADVIKIENPKGGDEARKWGPPFVGNESTYFLCLNRNKRSVCIDLKTRDGREIVYDLARKSDVLVENYVPGKLDSLKLGYDDLKLVAPRLIYCSITGYGSEGPYCNRPGYDVIAASIGGLLHITGPRNGEPVKVGVAMTDIATGLFAHGAILAALIKRSRTNLGQKIDCNLLSTQVATLINIGSNYLIAGKDASRWGTAHESIVPYESFPTKDGYFTLGTGSDTQFRDLCTLMKLPQLSRNPKFLTNKDRVENRLELITILRDEFKKKTNSEWSQQFKEAAFPNGPVNDLKNTFNDQHVKEIGLVKEVAHPTAGCIKIVGPPVKYGEGGNDIRLPPPLLGQHTREVLAEILGYDEETLKRLKENNIIS